MLSTLRRLFLLISAFFCLTLSLTAQVGITMLPGAPQPTQSTNDKLALQYFELKEYEKANVYFNDLYDKNPDQWFPYYYKSLLGAKDYSRAEKITKKQFRRN